MPRPRIHWTEQETLLVAHEFVRLRRADPLSDGINLFQEAEGVLDPNRQRGLAGMNAAKLVADVAKRLWDESMRVPAPAITPTPKNEAPALSPPTLERKPREPLVIEIRAEKADLQSVLATCPTPLLLGAAIERLLAGRLAQSSLVESLKVEAQADRPAPPALVKADSVEGGEPLPDPSAAKIKRVLILGLLPGAADMIRAKTSNFANLLIHALDTAANDDLGSVQCDYVFLARELVTAFQAAQIRRRFTDPSRIIHFEGTVDELLRRLADLNSGRRAA